MVTRRGFLAGLVATGVLPAPSWADVGNPRLLSAAKMPDGAFRLFGLGDAGQPVFSVALPDRGHAAAAHPLRPEAIAFARRPGTYAVGVNCLTGREFTRFEAPAARHFYGHGVFGDAGARLFTPMNDYELGVGRIGFWDAAASYAYLGEFSSGGVGPHDIALLPDGASLVVANGGIDTHPESGRTKLNVPEMRPNLCYLDLEGTINERVELDAALHHNSIRHLSLRADGLVAFAMQWQGDANTVVPLLGLHRRGEAPKLLAAPEPAQRAMKGYGASVVFSGDGAQVAISSSRGGLVHIFDVESGGFVRQFAAPDVSGIAAAPQGFLATTGQGHVYEIRAQGDALRTRRDVAWDNHLVML